MAGAEDTTKSADSAPDPEAQSPRLERFARRFAAGEVLFRDGEPAGEAFLLQEGRVRLLKRVGAIERSLRVLSPGELFGESALVAGTPHNSTAVALSPGSALVLDQETFQHVLAGNPSVGSRVLQQLIRRLRDAEDQIEILMVRDTQSKVAVALVKLARQAAGSARSDDGPLELDVSPMDLSSRVGLDVDAVKRAVLQLRESGYVRIVEEKLVIENLDALAELVGLLAVKDQIVGGNRPGSSPQASPRRSR
jgi:CRP/FNR family cyclic AMP-dependent transcriptional regulator